MLPDPQMSSETTCPPSDIDLNPGSTQRGHSIARRNEISAHYAYVFNLGNRILWRKKIYTYVKWQSIKDARPTHTRPNW